MRISDKNSKNAYGQASVHCKGEEDVGSVCNESWSISETAEWEWPTIYREIPTDAQEGALSQLPLKDKGRKGKNKSVSQKCRFT